jgi:hypothetical protein
MAGQAGWYRSPGEEATLRYWNGTAWTHHRQPDPAAQPPSSPRLLAEDPDPMAEYERQFETRSPSAFDLQGFDLGAHPLEVPEAVSVPVASQSTEFGSQRSTFAARPFPPRPETVAPPSLGPIALGPAAPHPTAATADAAPAPIIVPSDHSAVGVPPNRKAVLGAFRGMVLALLVILIGIGGMAFFGAQSQAGAGEVKTIGIVTSLGSTTDNSCTPIARFAVKGKSFTANSNTSITPCPVGLGQDVDVIYTSADPAAAARIELGGSFTQYLWLLPLLGALLFLASLTTFIVRAGSVAKGVRLIRDGRKRPKRRVTGA